MYVPLGCDVHDEDDLALELIKLEHLPARLLRLQLVERRRLSFGHCGFRKGGGCR